MLRKLHPLTSLAAVLLLVSVYFYLKPNEIVASILVTASFFAATAEVSKFTSRFQFAMVLLSAAFAGVMLDEREQSFPWLSCAVLLAGTSTIIRISFFSFFSYTGYLWTELCGALIALAVYLTGYFLVGYSWQAHAYSAPFLVFSLAFAVNTLFDHFQLLGFSRLGYQVRTGQPAKDFELPDENGIKVKLSDFKGKRPVLLIFVRGDWCPMCHMMLRTYEKRREEFQSKNVLVMAIGPDPVGVNKAMVEKLGIDYRVLSDEGQRTAKVYGVQLQEYKNNFAPKQKDGIPLPASFLVDRDGVVRYISSPERVGEYLNPGLVFEALGVIKN